MKNDFNNDVLGAFNYTPKGGMPIAMFLVLLLVACIASIMMLGLILVDIFICAPFLLIFEGIHIDLGGHNDRTINYDRSSSPVRSKSINTEF
jgi:hypothetical protein